MLGETQSSKRWQPGTHPAEVKQLHPGIARDGFVVPPLQEVAPVVHHRPPPIGKQQLPHRERDLLVHALLPLLPRKRIRKRIDLLRRAERLLRRN